MKLQIELHHVEALLKNFPRLTVLQEQLRFGETAQISFQQLEEREREFLGGLYRDGGPALQGRAAQLATLQQALNDQGVRFTGEDLEDVVPALVKYLLEAVAAGCSPQPSVAAHCPTW